MTSQRSWTLNRFELGQPINWEAAGEVAPVPVPARANTQRGIFRILLTLLLLALVYTASIAQDILVPMIFGAFIAMLLSPVVSALTRIMPRFLATMVVMLALLATLIGAVSMLIEPAAEWLQQAPKTMQSLAPKLRTFMKPINAATHATDALVQIGPPTPPPPKVGLVSAGDALLQAPRLLVKLFTVLLLCYFFLLRGDDMLRRLVELSPTLRHKRNAVLIVRAIQSDSSRYLLTTALINTALAVCTAIGLHLLGLKDPILWGVVAGIMNFIPYVGAMLMLVLFSVLGLLQFPHPGVGLLPAGFFLLLATIEGQLISPAILGARLSLSPLAILLWLMLWGWLWGVAGVMLGVPLLMCLKIFCERFDDSRWIARAIE